MKNALICTAVLAAGLAAPLALAGDTPSRGGPQVNDGSFNYQGYLEFEGVPANGEYYFRFSLFDSFERWLGAWWSNVGPVTVTDGLFEVDVLMGDEPVIALAFWKRFGGLVKYMEIEVGEDQGEYTTLSPRVRLGSSPHALFSQSAGALQFPYTDTYSDKFGDPVTMISLTNKFGGTVLEASAGILNTSRPVILVNSASPIGANFGDQNGAVQIDAGGRLTGILSVADRYPMASLITENTGNQVAAMYAEIGNDVPGAVVFEGLNLNSGNYVYLGTPIYAGDFYGDVIARDDLRVQGEPTRDYLVNSPSPIGPLAYASVGLDGTPTASTANISVSWDSVNQWYLVSVVGEALHPSTHTVLASVVELVEPRLATIGTTQGSIIVRIWDLNSGNALVQDSFSIVIYDANPVALNNANQTQPRIDPVKPFERFKFGVGGQD